MLKYLKQLFHSYIESLKMSDTYFYDSGDRTVDPLAAPVYMPNYNLQVMWPLKSLPERQVSPIKQYYIRADIRREEVKTQRKEIRKLLSYIRVFTQSPHFTNAETRAETATCDIG